MATQFDGGPALLPWAPLLSIHHRYSANECVGSATPLATFPPLSMQVLLKSLVITDADKQGVALDVVLFRGLPTESRLHDKITAEIGAAALNLVLGVISVSRWTPEGIGKVATFELPAYVGEGKNVWLVTIARGKVTWTT
jgi:hypothetical protein